MSDALRQHVLDLLNGGNAHVNLETALARFPVKLRGKKPKGAEHSVWQLLEHIRIAQWDILEFSRNPQHTSPPWPEGYWTQSETPPSDAAWAKSIRSVQSDRRAMEKLVTSKKMDLLAPIKHGSGQTLLRETMLLADHTAYHVGQIVLLRRLLGAWTNS